MKLIVDYPSAEEERAIVAMVIDEERLPKVEPTLDRASIRTCRKPLARSTSTPKLIAYATELVQATRTPNEYRLELAPYIDFGASPRASIALAQGGRAHALLDGRDAVTPDDVKAVAPAVLRHRILATYYADAEKVTSDQMVEEILSTVKVP